MSNLFLNAAQLEDLTGLKQKSAQRRWLDRNNYRYETRADGSPAVLVAQVERRQRVAPSRTTGPDLAALDQLQ